MLTFKLNIKENSLQKEEKTIIKNYCENYSFLFRKLFVNFQILKENKQEYLDFKDKYERKYNLDSWFFESCKNEVETKIAQESTQTEKRESKIKSIENELKNTIFNTKKEKRRKFNLQNSLKYLQKRKTKKITFGGKYLLQKISFLANDKPKNENELKKTKKEFQKKRILPIFSIGEAPQKSNRKFVFDFTNKKITFKPNKNTKVNFEFNCSKNQEKTLKKLQNFIGKMPFSVRLDKEFIWISFDEQKLHNFEFKEKEYFAELKNLKKTENFYTESEKKEIYQKYLSDQKQRKLVGKNENRYLAVDLNPENIGFCVVEKLPENKENQIFKIIYKACLDLQHLSTKKRLSSTDTLQIYQNNKRKFEICEAWKYIFDFATHYKVSNFVVEELSFKSENHNESSNIANRKTKNIWHRMLTTNLINKYCNSLGIEKVEINPAYSSFVGNVQYSEFDPIASSLEIARRGITKYWKGSSIFPHFCNKDRDAMCQIFGLDVPCDTLQGWKQSFDLFRTSGLRYRRILDKTKISDNNLHSYKSCINVYAVV